MTQKKDIRNIILIVLLVTGLILGIILHVQGMQNPTTNPLFQWLGTLTLLFGFINIYYTSKRSKHFLIPAFLWAIGTIILLALQKTYTDIPIYLFTTVIIFYQYNNWSKNEDESNEAQLIYGIDRFVILILIMSTGLFFLFYFILGGTNKLLGSIASSFGIGANILLARRYYISQIVYLVINILQMTVMLKAGLGQQAIIGLIFFLNGIVFLLFNNQEKNY